MRVAELGLPISGHGVSGSVAPSTYVRYLIETEKAPPIFPEPNRYEPKVRKTRLALLLLHEFNAFILSEIFKVSNWKRIFTKQLYGEILEGTLKEKISIRWKTFLDRPCIYGVFSGPLGGFRPKEEKCTACMRCKQEYPDVIEDIVWGKEFRNMNFFGLKPDDVYTIWYEAREGKELVKGMGYRGPFAGPGWDSIWLDMSEIVRPTRDGKMGREYISTSVDIGRKPKFLRFDRDYKALRTIRIELPILFDCSNSAWLNRETLLAVVEAARRCNTQALVQLRTYNSLSQQQKAHALPIITADDTYWLRERNPSIPIIEMDVEGREPPARGTIQGADIVIARVRADDSIEDSATKLVALGYDGIHILAPPDGSNIGTKSRHIKDVVRAVHTRLVQEGTRDEVTLLATGGILIAEHVPKAILCGCDAVGIETSIHLALQAKFFKRTEGSQISTRKVDPKWGAQRLTNLMAAWHEQFIEALSAMGKRDGRRLRGDVGRGIFYEEMVKEAFGDIEIATSSDR